MTKEHWDVIRAEFITSAVRAEQYPKPYLPEVAFIGRSNVGKSSLINSVCRRNGLARVSVLAEQCMAAMPLRGRK